jgi:hypothetical protein
MDGAETAATARTTASRKEERAAENMERQGLLQKLDLLRLKFKQSIIPTDIERQKTPVVRMVMERNMLQLKRVRAGCRRHDAAPPCVSKRGHVQAGHGGRPRRHRVPPRQVLRARHEQVHEVAPFQWM